MGSGDNGYGDCHSIRGLWARALHGVTKRFPHMTPVQDCQDSD